MKKTLLLKNNAFLVIMLLLTPIFSTAAVFPGKIEQVNGGKQIVFMLDGADLKLTDVKISGRNQNNEVTTWEKHSPSGFRMAYTKDWWWVEDFVQIDFSYEDAQTQTSYTRTCLIDALVQPSDTTRVEIIYFKDQGCAGGEGGSSNDPVAKPFEQKAKKVNEAFKTIVYYTSDFNMDVFIDTFSQTAVDNVSCVMEIGEAVDTFGLSGLAALSTDTAYNCGASINDIKEVLTPKE